MGRVDLPTLFGGCRGEPVIEGGPQGTRETAIPHTRGKIDIAQDIAPVCQAARSPNHSRYSDHRHQISMNFDWNFALASMFGLRGGRTSSQVYGMRVC